MSNTPRTDAFLQAENCSRDNPAAFDWAIGFARSLERENAQLRSQLSAVLQSTGHEAREIAALREMLMKCRNESNDFELHCEIDAVLFKHGGRK